ncbi:MAG: hypothetical protein QM820_06580 [Minicystis sp.]
MIDTPSPPRRSLLRAGLLAALIVAGGALALRSARKEEPPRPEIRSRGAAPAATIGMDTPLGATDVKVDVAQLIRETFDDENAAVRRYQGKTVEVTGIALALDRSDPEIVTLLLGKQVGSKETPCACQGGPALERAAAAIPAGEALTVRGKFAGVLMMRIVLLNCEIVR